MINIIEKLKKWLSYIIPFTTKTPSRFSETLEINLVDGRKLLDTAIVNYSYGSLERVLRFALKNTDISLVKDILLLGLGGGSVVKLLRKEHNFQGTITGVDIDSLIIQLAKDEFGLKEDERTTFICADAFDQVQQSENIYDLIIIDLFIHDIVPRKFYSATFWQAVLKIVNAEATIIFNTMEMSEKKTFIKITLRQERFLIKEYFNVEGANQLLIARRYA